MTKTETMVRDMTDVECAEMERITLELHARFDELLKGRKPRFQPRLKMDTEHANVVLQEPVGDP